MSDFADTPVSSKPMHWASAALFVAALLIAFLRLPEPGDPRFAPVTGAARVELPTAPTGDNLPAIAPVAGPASLALLPDGRVAAAWLAGPDDDESAAVIWFATLGRDGWSAPQVAAKQESTAAGTLAHLNKLGRPVLFAEGSWLHVWYESLTLGSWAGAAIVHSASTDGGKSWSKAERLPTSALGTLGSGLGGPPLALADGGIALPLDQRRPGQGSELLRLSATGRVIDKIRLGPAAAGRQPAVVALDEKRAIAIPTGDGSTRRALLSSHGGQHWAAVAGFDLPGPATPLALLRLGSGKLLLAGNPPRGRESLQLWLSADDGQSWTLQHTVEAAADGAAEFAYPALLQASDGHIHLAYTWRRQRIKHLAFSEAWLEAARP